MEKEEIKKNFANSKNLTECDGARQQYDYENHDKIGNSTPPIDLEKGPISTMSPKVVGDETQEPIIGGGQLDHMKDEETEKDSKVEKDYAPVTGVYSTQHQIPGEMSNLITRPIKVDPAVETKRKNILNQNSEPYFEKMNPKLDDEVFFDDLTDDIIFEGAENLAKKIELSLNSSLKKSINSWFFDISKSTEIEDALVSLKKNLILWNKDISKGTLFGFNALIEFGIKAGIRKSKVPTSRQTYNIIKDMSMSEKEISLLFHNFSDLTYSKISKCVKDIPMGSYKQKRAIESELKYLKPKTKSMIKSEVAKFGNFSTKFVLKV
jgi:hypothetical protein